MEDNRSEDEESKGSDDPDSGEEGGLTTQKSFDFEQEGLVRGSDVDDNEEDSDGWGSEFDGNEDFDEYEVEADASGQMQSVDMMHKTFWEKLAVIDDKQVDNDSTGRYKYVRACVREKIRPSTNIILALGKEFLLLQHQGVRSCDAIALADGLEQNRCCSVVNLSGNPLAEAGEALGSVFMHNTSIERLILRQAHQGFSLAKQLGDSLRFNDTLTHLDLGSNRLGDNGVACIVDSVGENVAYLGLSDNQAGPKAANAVVEMLRKNHSLLTLDLAWNHMRKPELNVMARAVGQNKTLSTLWLAWNGVGDHDPTCEKKEDRAKSPDGRESMVEPHGLVDMISNSTSLTDLDLSNCRIGPRLGAGTLPFFFSCLLMGWYILAFARLHSPTEAAHMGLGLQVQRASAHTLLQTSLTKGVRNQDWQQPS